MESIKRIIVGAEVLGHLELPSDGAVEHGTECDTIDRAGMDAEPYDPARVLIHDGFRSIGVAALRASMRSSRRPSGRTAVTYVSLAAVCRFATRRTSRVQD